VRARWLGAAVAAMLALPASAGAAQKVGLLVIGNNEPPLDPGSGAPLARLRFADDDAAAFFELMEGAADTAHLLTVMDGDTQTLYPRLVARTSPPTLAELRAAVADLEFRIAENRRRGDDTVIYIFFSGHGTGQGESGPALALIDGGITAQVFYEEILEKLPAEYVHVFVDACHAEAVVRPRDLDARPQPVSASEASAFLVRSTLARFPRVGAIVAAASDAQAHEWDFFQQGVFTHELLSALRGAADVNHDGRIEYSEAYAFLTAANREVADPRARLAIVAHPPAINGRVPVLDRTSFPRPTAILGGVPARAGVVEIEDGAGRAVASLRDEPGYFADVDVPSGILFVRANGREARVDARGGEKLTWDGLPFHDPTGRSRGALGEALRRGLYASAFGPNYYRGFMARAPELVAVSFAGDASVLEQEASSPPVPVASVTLSRRLLLGGGVSNAVADGFGAGGALRIGMRQAESRGLLASLDASWAAHAGASEKRLLGSVGWSWSMVAGPGYGWIGGAVSLGAIVQSATDGSDHWSPVTGGGPVAGYGLDVGRRLGLWAEGAMAGALLRRESRLTVTWLPTLLAGISLAL